MSSVDPDRNQLAVWRAQHLQHSPELEGINLLVGWLAVEGQKAARAPM